MDIQETELKDIVIPNIHGSVADPPLIDTNLESTLLNASQCLQEDLDLNQIRSEWQAMLERPPTMGDARYVVPRHFVTAVLSSSAESLADLKLATGPIENKTVVDESGHLFSQENDPVPSIHISSELYLLLLSLFGLSGEPVVRHVIMDEQGNLILERFPPRFTLHSLCKAISSYRSSFHSGVFDMNSKLTFTLSQAKTFGDLIQIVKSRLGQDKSPEFRLWFITTENLEELPVDLLVSTFINKIERKKIITPGVLDCLLQSQGIRSSSLHLVVEPFDKTSKSFLIDQALSTLDLALLDFDNVMSRGGNLGLSNLGNTCYMNSALQCLVHVPEVNYYFFYDKFEKELNTTNPLGNQGNVAIAFSNLLHKLFDLTDAAITLVNPRDFKYTIGRYSSMFHGYQQQDSQEFLSWLLDALHEDLNRIHDKPYCEKPELDDEDVDDHSSIVTLANQCWELHKKRNDSIIVDLFTGMYQSTLVCPSCSKRSVTFDPFMDLTLPLPVNKKWYHEFIIVDLSQTFLDDPVMKLEVELTKSSSFTDLVVYLAERLDVPSKFLFLFEVFRNYFYKNFLEESYNQSFLPITEIIGDGDEIYVYIIPHAEDDRIVPVISTKQDEDRSYNIIEPFGIPLFIVLNKAEECADYEVVTTKIAEVSRILSKEKSSFKHIPKTLYQNDTTLSSKKTEPVVPGAIALDDEEKVCKEDFPPLESMESAFENANLSICSTETDIEPHYVIKCYREETFNHSKGAERYNRPLPNVRDPARLEETLQIPKGRPQFGKLPKLIERVLRMKQSDSPESISDLKRLSDPSLTEGSLIPGDSPIIATVDTALSENDVDEDDGTGKRKSLIMNNELRLPGEVTDTEANWDNLDGIFATADPLGPSENSSNFGNSPEEHLNPGCDALPFCIDGNDLLVIEWNSNAFEFYFDNSSKRAWENLKRISNPQLEESKRRLAAEEKATISLYDCLRNFSTPELLGEQDLWYCPRCKLHRRATKAIQLWSTGDILTIHLKRFHSARSLSDKIGTVVDFPIEGLDISDYVNSNKPKDSSLIYDLIGVDNHYGGLGGGHYTASAKNFRDEKWYYFNDGRVTPLADPKECVTGAAYLLFYRKRGSNQFAGGSLVETLISQGRSDFENKLERRKEMLRLVMEEIEIYNLQEQPEIDESHGMADCISEKNDDYDDYDDNDDNDDDLYGDLNRDKNEQESALLEPHEYSTSAKKSRSPVTEQNMKFDNQRKQRLISKGSDLPRSVNIILNYSSSTSNLASPKGSSEEDEEDEDEEDKEEEKGV